MFSARRVFGGTPDTFKVTLEFGNSHTDWQREHHSGISKTSAQPSDPVGAPSAPVRLALVLATLEFEWTSDETDTAVIERFTQRVSALVLSRIEERVMLALSTDGIAHAASFPESKLHVNLSVACSTPAIRNIQVSRSSSSGSPPEALLTSLLKHCDLRGVWKVKSAEGFGNFWATCAEPTQWTSLRTLNLSYCGLTFLPTSIGAICSLRILRASHNKLSSLPAEMRELVDLQVLAVDHNLLTALPVDLRRCSALREINLEGNKMSTLVLDLRALAQLQSLQLYGNPLEFLPELSPCTQLRSLSLANVRIMADAKYTRWEVEVSNTSYMSRSHKLAPLFRLTFRRSSLQHPLLAGALGRIAEDPANCELIAKEEAAIQQLVLMAMSENPVVVGQACKCIGMLAEQSSANAKKLVHHDVISAVTALTKSRNQESQVHGLVVLSSLARGCDAVSAELLSDLLLERLQVLVQTGDPGVRQAALQALSDLAFCRENKAKVSQYPGLLPLVIGLAQPGDPAGTSIITRRLALRVLAVLGENDQVRTALRKPPITGRGIRVLSMDGGGMKGLAMVVFLRHIERRTGRPLHELFDLITGTSTGAILAVSLAVVNSSLDHCQGIYTNLGQKVFNKAGSIKEELTAGWRDSLYRMYHSSSQNLRVAVYGYKHDAAPFEQLLKDMCNLEDRGVASEQFIDTACLGGPKVAVVSTLASVTPASPFVFRNYELPPGGEHWSQRLHACRGSSKHLVWQAVRASSAAPYYLDDFVCGEDRFQDGAVVANNPAVIALQQARLLWPDTPIDALVSLGSGIAPVSKRVRSLSSVEALSAIVESACSTERVDEALSTLGPMVPGFHYFRFQSIDERCGMELDDIDPASWAKLEAAAEEYCLAHAARFDEVADLLMAPSAAAADDDSDAEMMEAGFAATAATSGQPPAKLGARRGLLVLEAPPPTGLRQPTAVELVAAALATLPALARRCNINECLSPAAAGVSAAADHVAMASPAGPAGPALNVAASPPSSEGVTASPTLPQEVSPTSRLVSANDARCSSARASFGSGAGAAHQGSTASRERTSSTSVVAGDMAPIVSAAMEAEEASISAPVDVPADRAQPPAASLLPTSPPPSLMDYFFPSSWSQQAGSSKPTTAAVAVAPIVTGAGTGGHSSSRKSSAGGGRSMGVPSASAPATPMPGPAVQQLPKAAGMAVAGGHSCPVSPTQLPPPPAEPADLHMSIGEGIQVSLTADRELPLCEPGPLAELGAATASPASTTLAGPCAEHPTKPQELCMPHSLGSHGSNSHNASWKAGSDHGLNYCHHGSNKHDGRGHSYSNGSGSRALNGQGGGKSHSSGGHNVRGRAVLQQHLSRVPHITPRDLLQGLLQDLAERLGVVHFALHHEEGLDGLVAQWRSDAFAVIEPGGKAEDLVSQLGGRPGTSLRALCERNPHGFHQEGCVHIARLGMQQLSTSGGTTVSSFVFQRTAPWQLLAAEDVLATEGNWEGLLITSTAALPDAFVQALLQAGVRGVVAPMAPLPLRFSSPLPVQPCASTSSGVDSASFAAAATDLPSVHGAELALEHPEEVVRLFVHLYEQLYAGQPLQAALRHAEAQCSASMSGYLICHVA